MKADESRLGTLLEGPRQYVVPYFQRAYSWRRQQWNTLFDDILEMYELDSPESHHHFLGSMVLLAEAGATLTEDGLRPTLLIDGQQRMVTLSLFLAAMRDTAREISPAFADRIHDQFLVNSTADAAAHRLKVVCTHDDQPAFARTIESGDPPPSPIRDAYRSFRSALADQLAKGVDLEHLLRIVAVQLSFVAITLDSDDNPYRIFESLNAKGMPLTQGDLLRNYFFMRLPTAEHEHWYSTVWAPMQRRLGDRFDDYMRDFLVKEGTPIKSDEVYQEWRKRLAPLDEDGIREMLRDLAAWSVEYDQILHPQRETQPDLRKQLARLTLWSTTVPNSFKPLLMRLNADYHRGHLTADELREVFSALESFFVRRLFASAPARDDNQLLIELYNAAATEDHRAERFIEALSRPQVGWPTDAEFERVLVRFPLYFASHPDQRKLILEAIEDTYPRRTPMRYDTLDLQLITPLLPRNDWLEEVGVTEDQYWSIIGTLGNFTWVPRDRMPDLGVADRKKELFKMTRYGLELVKDFARVERWTRAEIENRSQRMAERALRVWPGPRR